MSRDFVILKSTTVIEHDDLYFDENICCDELDMAMFRYKNKDKIIVSHKDFDHDIKMHVSKGVV